MKIFPFPSSIEGRWLMFFPTRFFRFLYSSSLLPRWINFTIRRFFTFFESGSLCAAAICRWSISTPASEPTSFTSWLGFSYYEIGTPLISKQSLLRYCWVSSRAHSTRYSDWSCFSIVPASSPSFSSSEFVIVVYFRVSRGMVAQKNRKIGNSGLRK